MNGRFDIAWFALGASVAGVLLAVVGAGLAAWLEECRIKRRLRERRERAEREQARALHVWDEREPTEGTE